MTHVIGRGRYARAVYPSRGRGNGGEGNIIAWRPDGTGDARTWHEVMMLLGGILVPSVIDVAPQPVGFDYHVPATTTPYLLRYATFSSRLAAPIVVVDVDDGAVLQDLSMVNGSVGLRFHSTAGDALAYTPTPSAPGVLTLQRNGRLQNAGSVPVITAQTNSGGPGFVLASFENGNIDSGSAPLVEIADNATAIFEVIGAFNTGGTAPTDLFSGSASAQLWLFHDGTLIFPFTAQTSFFGTVNNIPLGCSPSGGPTALRPAPVLPLSVGVSYFDTSIAPPRPIWWDGTQWVDATGTPV